MKSEAESVIYQVTTPATATAPEGLVRVTNNQIVGGKCYVGMEVEISAGGYLFNRFFSLKITEDPDTGHGVTHPSASDHIYFQQEKRFMEMDFANLSIPLSVGENSIHAVYDVHVHSLNPAARESIQRLGIKIWEGRIVSNKEELTVQEPTGINLEAFKLLKLDDMLTRPGAPGIFFGSDEAEKVLIQYPESRYAKYCRYYLGLRYTFNELDKGLSYLRRFIEENPNHPLVDDAQYSIARNLEEKGKTEEAKKEIDKFFTGYPQSELTSEATRLKDLIERKQLVQPRN